MSSQEVQQLLDGQHLEKRFGEDFRRDFDGTRFWMLRWLNVIFQVGYAGDLLYVVLSAYTSRSAVASVLVESQGFGGWLVIMALSTVVLLIAVHIIVNNVMSERHVFKFARENLHLIYVIAGVLYLVPIFVSSRLGLTPPASTFLYLAKSGLGLAYGVLCAYMTGERKRLERMVQR